MSGKVVKIGISKNKGGKIVSLNDVEAIKGKGLVNERHFKENNEKRCQITLIEIENINQLQQNKWNVDPSDKFFKKHCYRRNST